MTNRKLLTSIHFIKMVNPQTIVKSTLRVESQERNLAQIDYVYPIDKNTQFEAGYRGTDNKRIIDFEVEIIDENDIATTDENLSNVLDFEQEVHALYTCLLYTSPSPRD